MTLQQIRIITCRSPNPIIPGLLMSLISSPPARARNLSPDELSWIGSGPEMSPAPSVAPTESSDESSSEMPIDLDADPEEELRAPSMVRT